MEVGNQKSEDGGRKLERRNETVKKPLDLLEKGSWNGVILSEAEGSLPLFR